MGPVLAEAVVIDRISHGTGYVELRLLEPRVAGAAQPGQFLHILCGEGPSGDGLRRYLRRPLSLFRINSASGEVGVLFRIHGEGTEWLANRRSGDRVSVIGPLGNGFPLPPIADGGRFSVSGGEPEGYPAQQAYLVGGGVGIPPLLPLAQRLVSAGHGLRVFLGGRTAADVLAVSEFERTGAYVAVATDDGSLGVRSVVTSLLEAALRESSGTRGAVLYACGPVGMLRVVKDLAARFAVPAYLSLEERMACGVGACLGCPVRFIEPEDGGSRRGLPAGFRGESGVIYRRVCCDGPVFPAWQVVL